VNIIVCIKQVPDTTNVKINPETNTLIREGVSSIINPFDMYAIEEGLRLKEKFGGKVTVISLGPPQSINALKEAVGMGTDEAVQLSDRAFAGSDSWATAYTLSLAIKKWANSISFFVASRPSTVIPDRLAQVLPASSASLNSPMFLKLSGWIREQEQLQ